MRHVKRAARADLHRFKAFIEMSELETGAWRGVIEDGELVEPHDDAYDKERDYSDLEEIKDESEQDDVEQPDSRTPEKEGNGSGGERTQRFARQAGRSGGSGRRKPAASKSAVGG